MKKRYAVVLTAPQRDQLKRLLAAGTASARKLTHARILLKADQGPDGPGWVDEAIAEAVEVSQPTVSRVRKQYVEQGLEAALTRRPPTREYVRKLDGAQEAHLLALACAKPPTGQARWRSWRRPSPTRRYAGCSKKRAPAAPESVLVHSS